MAHSDTLIFLTNISWIFLLFLFCYFFFVIYFLPTFYKKVRIRSLIRLDQQRFVLILIVNSVVGLRLFLKELSLSYFNDLMRLLPPARKGPFNFLWSLPSSLGGGLGTKTYSGFLLESLSEDMPTKIIGYSTRFNKRR